MLNFKWYILKAVCAISSLYACYVGSCALLGSVWCSILFTKFLILRPSMWLFPCASLVSCVACSEKPWVSRLQPLSPMCTWCQNVIEFGAGRLPQHGRIEEGIRRCSRFIFGEENPIH